MVSHAKKIQDVGQAMWSGLQDCGTLFVRGAVGFYNEILVRAGNNLVGSQLHFAVS